MNRETRRQRLESLLWEGDEGVDFLEFLFEATMGKRLGIERPNSSTMIAAILDFELGADDVLPQNGLQHHGVSTLAS